MSSKALKANIKLSACIDEALHAKRKAKKAERRLEIENPALSDGSVRCGRPMTLCLVIEELLPWGVVPSPRDFGFLDERMGVKTCAFPHEFLWERMDVESCAFPHGGFMRERGI